MGKKRSWTEDDVAYLRKEYPYRPSYKIAKELGRTENAVNLKASRLGISKETPTVITISGTHVRCYDLECKHNSHSGDKPICLRKDIEVHRNVYDFEKAVCLSREPKGEWVDVPQRNMKDGEEYRVETNNVGEVIKVLKRVCTEEES